ncbi:MAG: RNA methyltransferase [Myxococcota bacterium]
MSRRMAIALLHYPVLDRHGELFTTTLTNLDLHDMSRSARTYGAKAFFIVHPLASQRLIAERMVGHWRQGPGGKRIPDRAEALRITRVVPAVEAALEGLGEEAEIWTTAARPGLTAETSWSEARTLARGAGPPILLCFGTGWGLSTPFLEAATRHLAPIDGAGTDYNHLSVRAACAIACDRIWGPTRD